MSQNSWLTKNNRGGMSTCRTHEYMHPPGPSPQARKRRNARVFICSAETHRASDYIGSLMVSPSQARAVFLRCQEGLVFPMTTPNAGQHGANPKRDSPDNPYPGGADSKKDALKKIKKGIFGRQPPQAQTNVPGYSRSYTQTMLLFSRLYIEPMQ